VNLSDGSSWMHPERSVTMPTETMNIGVLSIEKVEAGRVTLKSHGRLIDLRLRAQ
jgi:hypothetical protein